MCSILRKNGPCSISNVNVCRRIEANNDGGTFDRLIRIFDPVSGYRGLENFPKLPFCCHFIDRVRIRIDTVLSQPEIRK